MEINTVKKLEKKAIKSSRISLVRLGFALFFVFAVFLYVYINKGGVENSTFLIVASLFGAYMAMNIGANDVANNIGPAVGSKALTMTGAIAIAAIFEASGALIAGGDVVQTIKKGIIDIHSFGFDIHSFIWAMMAALLAAALWLNFATYFKAPVSTTHSIVGGVMGAGIAAFGFGVVAWGTMGKIVASWIISPVIGGAIAAIFLYGIKKTIIFQDDRIKSAKKWIPFFVSIMAWAFATYITMKGFKHIWVDIVNFIDGVVDILPRTKKPTFLIANIIGIIVAIIVYFYTLSKLKNSNITDDSRKAISEYFTIPLIFAAALLSFAHGANDVANAVGPLAAISDAVINNAISAKAGIPFWVMAVGGFGISVGLALYGPKLIKTVGSEITELDKIRAFSIAIAAAITVIIASQLGLPVSSTHIAIGGVFGVGFLREWLDRVKNLEDKAQIERINLEEEKRHLEELKSTFKELQQKDDKTLEDYEKIVELIKEIRDEEKKIKKEKKAIKSVKKEKYVKRDAIKKIVAAWIVTVPVAALLSAMIFYMLKGMFI